MALGVACHGWHGRETSRGPVARLIRFPPQIDHAGRRSLGDPQAQVRLPRGYVATVALEHGSTIGQLECLQVPLVDRSSGVGKTRAFDTLKNGPQVDFPT